MKRESLFFGILYVIVFLPVIAMLVLTGTAMAEPVASPSNLCPDNFRIEATPAHANECILVGVDNVTTTKDGIRYDLCVASGEEFLLTVDLIKTIPFVQPGGTAIDFVVSPDYGNGIAYDDWVTIESVDIIDDGVTITFHIAAPSKEELPAFVDNDEWQFWAVTDGLDPQVGTTILNIRIDNT